MVDRDKVIKGLEQFIADFKPFCGNKFDWQRADDALALLKAQEVIPHRNYKYLSDYWCACGWHLGRAGIYNYCPQCGKKVKWNG